MKSLKAERFSALFPNDIRLKLFATIVLFREGETKD